MGDLSTVSCRQASENAGKSQDEDGHDNSTDESDESESHSVLRTSAPTKQTSSP
jgi:hypothetical protein